MQIYAVHCDAWENATEGNRYVGSLREARRIAMRARDEAGAGYLARLEIARPTREFLISVLNREAWVLRTEIIFKWEGKIRGAVA